jgi:hypothetical protein
VGFTGIYHVVVNTYIPGLVFVMSVTQFEASACQQHMTQIILNVRNYISVRDTNSDLLKDPHDDV